jgi:hypothetical protein|tara:strand:- start:201 stop:557 length:357 start_codon:yes stop_codon:yes gene_type:complete
MGIEEITKYINLASNVISGVDDVVRAFQDKPRRRSFQNQLTGPTRYEDPNSLENLLRQAGYTLDPAEEQDADGKTPQEKLEEKMIGKAVQDDPELNLDAIASYMDAVRPIRREDFYRQ